ncbi:MAG TPA: HigA family addiction module antitoxin [Propionibacteriaceae bacterium]|nr:HigA family addiction module antitoxin [Propionibacteriaceae bacterium]
MPPRRINEIVHGRRRITADTALRLARYFGTTDRFWLNLQTRFDLEIERDHLGTALDRIEPLKAVWLPGSGSVGRVERKYAVGMERETSVIMRWLAAGDRGDVDAFDALMHADAVIHAPRGLSTDGSEAEKKVWLDALAAMPDLRHEVQEVIAEGETEMARVVVTGTLLRDFAGVPGNGRTFQLDQAVICHVRDGKITEAWEIADVGSLVAQVT